MLTLSESTALRSKAYIQFLAMKMTSVARLVTQTATAIKGASIDTAIGIIRK